MTTSGVGTRRHGDIYGLWVFYIYHFHNVTKVINGTMIMMMMMKRISIMRQLQRLAGRPWPQSQITCIPQSWWSFSPLYVSFAFLCWPRTCLCIFSFLLFTRRWRAIAVCGTSVACSTCGSLRCQSPPGMSVTWGGHARRHSTINI